MILEDVPKGMTQCPRCTGCGYGDFPPEHPHHCETCAQDVIAVKRPGCRVCAGSGIIPCRLDHEHGGPEHPCGTPIERDGELCHHCDLPVEGDNGCQRGCWTPSFTTVLRSVSDD